MTLDELLQSVEPTSWVEGLEPYQRRLVQTLLANSKDPEIAAKNWLEASTSQTFVFGAATASRPFFDAVRREVLRFLCNENAYIEEKKKLLSTRNVTQLFVVSVMTTAIAPVVGTASAFLAPVIALILYSLGKVALKAICECNKSTWQDK